MPLSIRCDELQPGMRLAEAVISRGRKMLPGGKVLTNSDADALKRMFPTLSVRIGDPILDNFAEFEDDSRELGIARTTQQRIAGAMSEVQERFSTRASLAAVNFNAMQGAVSEVLEYLGANPVSAALLSRTLDSDSYLTDHAGNVFYLSMVLGSAVHDYVAAERQRQANPRSADRKFALNLTPLGLGAMFADLGMYPLAHLFGSNKPLGDADQQALREHPAAGTGMLPEGFSAVGKMVVRTHHENFDGTGYPDGKLGDRSHVFTRIVRIADAYDAATAQHVYREAKSPARVIWEMTTGPYSQFYDPVLMKVFSRLIQPFPIGAKLRLVDGRYAVVVRYNRQNPYLPTVLIAFDANNRRLPQDGMEGPISLQEHRDLRLHSFGDESLSFLYGTNMMDDYVPSRKEFRTLFDAAFP